MARIYDDDIANRMAAIWGRVEDAVIELDECMKTKSAEELAEEWGRFKHEFDRFYEILTDAIEL